MLERAPAQGRRGEGTGLASIFTRIIRGELPARFVWRDEHCVAFLTIAPLKPGHTLVVPRAEVDHWLDLEPGLAQHLFAVAQSVGRGVQRAFRPTKVGLVIVGLEVPHVHLHVSPIDRLSDLDFAHANASPDPAEMDRAARTLRAALRELGHAEVVD
jgi:diadenosine tetraphosphate (Ap4A) HIT family hydrolase